MSIDDVSEKIVASVFEHADGLPDDQFTSAVVSTAVAMLCGCVQHMTMEDRARIAAFVAAEIMMARPEEVAN